MKPYYPATAIFSPTEIELHYKRPLFSEMKQICCAEDVNRYLRESINLNTLGVKEHFWALFLSNANRLLGIALISIGTQNGVSVNVKEIFQLALITHSLRVIVAHNHPSGNLKPSANDKKVTEKIKKGLKTLEIELLDHLIITSEGFTSFAKEGLI